MGTGGKCDVSFDSEDCSFEPNPLASTCVETAADKIAKVRRIGIDAFAFASRSQRKNRLASVGALVTGFRSAASDVVCPYGDRSSETFCAATALHKRVIATAVPELREEMSESIRSKRRDRDSRGGIDCDVALPPVGRAIAKPWCSKGADWTKG
jgi:hypothetical protein